MTPSPKSPGIFQRAKGLFPGLFAKSPPQARNYAAAQVNRLTQGWTTISGSANSDIHRSLDAVRARSRKLSNDDEYVKKWLAMVTTNVVGPVGFRFQARVYDTPAKPDTLANDAIERAWEKFCKNGVCDVTGRQSMTDLQQLAIKAAARDGEFLVQIVRGKSAANPFGLALQVLDVDRLDTGYNLAAIPGGNAIRMGVEVNAYGRPVAYHLKGSHPGEVYQINLALPGKRPHPRARRRHHPRIRRRPPRAGARHALGACRHDRA